MVIDNATSHDQEMATRGSLHPSDAQEQLLGFLPIPSALLSVFGSSVIIFMVFKTRQQRKLTPYLRLLLAMSIYDIISSLTWSVAVFLRPQDTSLRMLSFGNKTTCNLVGFVNQISLATIIYQGMLGFYFVLKARFGFSNSYIARRVEPWMHAISIGHPLAFGIVFVVLDGFGEVTTGTGCWVVPAENCVTKTLCISRILSWGSYAFTLIIVTISLTVSNTIILLHARRQMRPAPHCSSNTPTLRNTASHCLTENDVGRDDDSGNSSTSTKPESKSVFTGKADNCKNEVIAAMLNGNIHSTAQLSKDQAQRLRLVSSQAVLFVVSFLICNGWTGIASLLEDRLDTIQDKMTMLVHTYPIFVLQAIFSPLQGFFNLMVFIRPKYLKFRHLHKGESRLWVVRRAIFGEEVKPTTRPQRNVVKAPTHLEALDGNVVPEKNPQTTKAEPISPSLSPLPRGMVSSLTASQGDFDHVMQEADDCRWEDKATTENSRNSPLLSHQKQASLLLCTSSALDSISENQESVFQALPVLPGSEDLVAHVFSSHTAHRRWSADSLPPVKRNERPKQEVGLCIPKRSKSCFDDSSVEETSVSSVPDPVRSPDVEKNHLPKSHESTSRLHGHWRSGSVELVVSRDHLREELALSIPDRPERSFDSFSIENPLPSPAADSSIHSPRSRESSSSMDRPIQAPQRRMSPPMWNIESNLA